MENLMDFDEAFDLIKNAKIPPLGSQKVVFNQSVGRILAQDIVSKSDMPRFDTSSMDGYAFNFGDLEILQSVGLEIMAINKAGNKSECECAKGCCIKTFTGSKIPKNADTMIIVEQVCVKNGRIFLLENEKILRGAWLRKAGENYKKGQILLHKNSLISPLDMGILSQNNEVFISVYRKPQITIITSGDEILEVGSVPQNDNYIYSSNNHLLAAICRSLGAEVAIQDIINDDKIAIKNAIKNALDSSDMVVTTGGMSKGDFDFTKEVIKEFGEVVFSGVNIKPGKVVAYVRGSGEYSKKHIVSLPGNPISSVISFLLFGRAILQKMNSLTPHIPLHKAKLLSDINKKDKRLEFVLSSLSIENGGFAIAPLHAQSYMVDSLKGAMAVVKSDGVKNGDIVDIILQSELLKL